LLFIGDIVGEPGRRAVKELVPTLRSRYGFHLVVANAENAAVALELPSTPPRKSSPEVDVMTSGDHLWDQKEVMSLLHNERRFLRPLNYPPDTPGQGSRIFEVDGLLRLP
jgi:calcineurin-like phosphoesterase